MFAALSARSQRVLTIRSFSQQFLRDYLTSTSNKREGVTMPDEIVAETAKKYREAYEKLTGKTWEQ
jgi:phosphoribosylaminoimidazole-succinocarboxamide synthase